MKTIKKTKAIKPVALFLGWLTITTLVFAALAWWLPASAAASNEPAVMLFAMPAAWRAVVWLTVGVMLMSGLGLLLARRKTRGANRHAPGHGVEARPQPND